MRLAQRAAEIQRDGLRDGFAIGQKSSASDLVSEVDRESEQAIVDALLAARPDDAILGEEGTNREGTSGVRWVIDPLDGTASYVTRYPGFGVSIGVEVDDKPTVGVVIDALVRTRGRDRARGRRDDVSARPSGDGARDSSSPPGSGTSRDARPRGRDAGPVIDRIADIRRSGSAAMDLCAVACGEVDAYYEVHLAPWDTAAGAVIVEAAGAVFRQIDQPDGEVLTVAVPTQLLEPLLGLLGDAGLTV